MRLRLALLLTPGLLLALLFGGIAHLASNAGLPTAIRLISWLSQERLQISGADGALGGPLDIAELRWQDGAQRLTLRQLHLDWSPNALWQQRRLQIQQLHIGAIDLDSPPDPTPPTRPDSLQLPLALAIDALRIDHLNISGSPPLTALSLVLDSDGQHHRLTHLQGESSGIRFRIQGDVNAAAPFASRWQARLDSQLEGKELTIELSAQGPLTRLPVQLTAQRGISGQASAVLTPFQQPAFSSARLQLTAIDPAAWHPAAPSAHLDLTADIVPEGAGFIGSFGLSNRQAGPLDRQRLPLSTLAGALRWQEGVLELHDLHAALPGRGGLSGSGRQQANGEAHLDLQVSQLDLQHTDSRLRSTRLAGDISWQADTDRQQIQLQLRDPRFAISSKLALDAKQVNLTQLSLRAGQAWVEAQGQLERKQPGKFALAGELKRFNPADFARVTPARVNAHFKLDGQLQPRPRVNAHFMLQDSQLAGQPLAGQGQLSIDWPRIPHADIHLQAGANQLHLSGAFGQADDLLHGEIAASDLAVLGLEGELSGQFDLRGSIDHPNLQARLSSRRLGKPGSFRASELNIAAQLASNANSPLQAELTLGQLDTPGQQAAVSELRLRIDGVRQAHQITLDSRLARHQTLQLRARGGWLGEQGWQGMLTEGQWQSGGKQPPITLQAPAEVALSGSAWHLGPLTVHGRQPAWQATVHAAATSRQLTLRLQARSAPSGQLHGELRAGLLTPWALDPLASWQGQLQAQAEQLDALGEALGDGWQTRGELSAEINLGGHPERPRFTGQIHGQALSLRQIDQGLALTEGDMALRIADNRLHIERLSFVSPHRPPPPALLHSLGQPASALSAPGRLSIGGQFEFTPENSDSHGWLDVTLDRVGAWQLPEQWLSLSGQSRLGWQDGQLTLRGQLAVDAGYWQLAPSGAPRLSDDVVVRRLGAAPPENRRPPLELDLTTDLGRHFLFETSGLSTRLSGDVRLQASGRDLPRASGRIRTRDGRFAAYGQKLEIERGQLTFQGLLDNPALDVRAVRKGLPVEAGVQVSGTAQRPVIKLVSEPAVPDAEKLTWLILGRAPQQSGSGDAALLLSAAGDLLGNDSSGLVQQLKKNFGLDEIGIRQGELGESGGPASTSRVAGSGLDNSSGTGQQIFSVSKRLSDTASLSYEQALGKTESIVKLSLELGRRLTLVGRAGSDNAVDLFYTLIFGRPPADPKRRPAKPE